jgi:EAL domain-containing protein (putative c-di-GMP-specific phosphodiesterase class I)
MEVVAEGIQTAAQVKKIRALGCEYGQGFLFSKPLPAGEIDGLLAPAASMAAGNSAAREFMSGE